MITDYVKTFSRLVSDTRLKADDPSGERWSLATVIDAVNFAALDFCLDSWAIVKRFTVQLIQYQSVYDLKDLNDSSATRERYMAFPVRLEYADTAVTSPVPGQWDGIRQSDHFVMDAKRVDLTVTGLPESYAVDMLGPNKIMLSASPNEDGSTTTTEKNLIVWFNAMPEPVLTLTDALTGLPTYIDSLISPIWHMAIPCGAAARLCYEGNSEDLERAVTLEAEFKKWRAKAISDSYRTNGVHDDLRPM